MSERFRGLLLTGSLIVVTGLQGCASSSPAAKPTPTKTQASDVVVAVPTENQQKPSIAPSENAGTAQSQVKADVESPPSVSAPVISDTAEPQPSPNSRMDAPKPAAKAGAAQNPKAKAAQKPKVETAPKPKPVVPEKPKPAKQTPPESVAKVEPAVVPKQQVKPAVPSIKPAAPPQPVQSPTEDKEVGDELSLEPEVVEPAIEVTLEALPMTIRGQWMLSASGDACSLSSMPIPFDDGQGMSKLQLVLTTQHWLVKTQSDIDLSYSGTGLTVDDDKYFPIDRLVRESDLMFTKEYAAITDAFIAGKSLRVTLGFWPTWPVTETKAITVPVQHFASAHHAWKQCLSLIK